MHHKFFMLKILPRCYTAEELIFYLVYVKRKFMFSGISLSIYIWHMNPQSRSLRDYFDHNLHDRNYTPFPVSYFMSLRILLSIWMLAEWITFVYELLVFIFSGSSCTCIPALPRDVGIYRYALYSYCSSNGWKQCNFLDNIYPLYTLSCWIFSFVDSSFVSMFAWYDF